MMMRSKMLLAGTAILAIAAPASADTLREALAKAYQTSPTLSAQRANVRALDENVPIARASGLPSVVLQSNYSKDLNQSVSATATGTPDQQVQASTTLSVPVFQGGAVSNSTSAARTRVEAGRLGLQGTESDLFTAVVGSYMDVIRDEAIVQLNQQNVRVLDVNLKATNDRFQVGDLTRTDVAQSQARLSLAQGQLQQAQARLISSRETYVRVVGSAPDDLQTPPALPNLPASADAAVDVALANNPDLLAAQKSRDATRYDIGVARAARLPQVSVNLGGTYYDYLHSATGPAASALANSGSGLSAGVGLRLPLFQGGAPSARIRQAEARRSQAIEQVTEAERGVIAQTRSAYAIWQSSEQVIQSSDNAVRANRLSLQGVRAENGVGNRTILDILNAEQELLNSQVTLVTAQRDAYVAGFALLAAMGRAQAQDLGLEGGPLYNPVEHYKQSRGSFMDFGGPREPEPTGTRTNATPAQTSLVNKPLDPELQDQTVDTAPANQTVAPATNR